MGENEQYDKEFLQKRAAFLEREAWHLSNLQNPFEIRILEEVKELKERIKKLELKNED